MTVARRMRLGYSQPRCLAVIQGIIIHPLPMEVSINYQRSKASIKGRKSSVSWLNSRSHPLPFPAPRPCFTLSLSLSLSPSCIPTPFFLLPVCGWPKHGESRNLFWEGGAILPKIGQKSPLRRREGEKPSCAFAFSLAECPRHEERNYGKRQWAQKRGTGKIFAFQKKTFAALPFLQTYI